MTKPMALKVDGFLKDFELNSRRGELIRSLRKKGFEGSDEQVLSDYKSLCSPVHKPEPEVENV